MNIGNAIRIVRKKKGISQVKLASMIGISQNALCCIEYGRKIPRKSTLDTICKVLDIPMSYVLFAAITDEDVPQEKLSIFKALQKPILDLF